MVDLLSLQKMANCIWEKSTQRNLSSFFINYLEQSIIWNKRRRIWKNVELDINKNDLPADVEKSTEYDIDISEYNMDNAARIPWRPYRKKLSGT